MPANYARYLIGTQRTAESNRELGFVLAFVAGAINAGGFLAVKQYTSHVTGMVSSLADNLALGQMGLVVDAAVGVLSFLLGAMCCAIMVNFARRRQLSSEYALPLLLEAARMVQQRGQLLGREGLPLRGSPRAVQPRLVVRTGAAAHEDARLGRAVATATTAVAIRTAKVFVGELRRERSGRWVQNLPKVGLQVLNLRAAGHGHARAAVLRVAVAAEVVVTVRSAVLVELAPQQAVVGLSKHQRRVRGACRILQMLLVL